MTTTVDARTGVLGTLAAAVLEALGTGFRLQGVPPSDAARWRTEILDADGAAVCGCELDTTGFPTAEVRYQKAETGGASRGWRGYTATWDGTRWQWNADLFVSRVQERHHEETTRRTSEATAAHAKAARRAWLDAAAIRLRAMLDAKDRVQGDGEGLVVTCNAKDDPDPQEWPAGDVLDLTLMWDEAGKPVALGMQTGRTAAPHSTSTFDLLTLKRALRYAALVATWVEEAADAR